MLGTNPDCIPPAKQLDMVGKAVGHNNHWLLPVKALVATLLRNSKLSLLAPILISFSSSAAEIETLDVSREQKRYSVTASFLLDACKEQVIQTFTDYERLVELNSSISESVVVRRSGGGTVVRTTIHDCVWFFCKNLIIVEELRFDESGDIRSTVLPESKDFSGGWINWRFSEDDLKTRVNYESELVIEVWVPPLVGSRLIEKSIGKNLQETLINAERLAASSGDQSSLPEGPGSCSQEGRSGSSK